MTVINSNRAVRGPVTAIPLVAGKGVKITADTVNNRYVAEVDETVLWTYDGTTPQASVTLSESASNFEFLDVYETWSGGTSNPSVVRIAMAGETKAVTNMSIGNNSWYLITQHWSISGTALSIDNAHAIHGSSYTSTDIVHESNTDLIKKTVVKVVGVNRIASN